MVVGLIIAGIAALITLTASTLASAVDLTRKVKTITFVNHFVKQGSKVLSIQEHLIGFWNNGLMTSDTIQIIRGSS